ncbi:rho GDP-dissociation inhibitor 1-like [Silene latifolia]|uniref:rho GDP-dissociation inhibitor 1-like n=1 Tax=Silene latifolia TaxID=37657 RepID=UPI003D78102B
MGFDEKKTENCGDSSEVMTNVVDSKDKEVATVTETEQQSNKEKFARVMSEDSILTIDDDDEDDTENKIDLGPLCSLKDQLEKDKDDESLRNWKEQLLGSVDLNAIGDTLDSEVKILSLAIKSPGRDDIVLQIPENGKVKGTWFTLKEGSPYNLQFTFQVNNNIVSGLKYSNTVWKTGVKVDSMKEMLGTFSPQAEPYTHVMPEDTTPSGIFARGSYSARTKFVDDDNKCYLEINYTFDIRKDWQQ